MDIRFKKLGENELKAIKILLDSGKYKQDENDKLLFKLIWPECKEHSTKERTCKESGRIQVIEYCYLTDQRITPQICHKCKKRQS